MTHSLHRQGTAENLSGDYIIFAIAAQGINAKGSAPLYAKFSEIVEKYGPVNLGDMRTGNTYSKDVATVRRSTQDNSIYHAVFTDPKKVAAALADLKAADLGLSIVLSGLFEHLGPCCEAGGVERHTIEHSLGVWGNTARLPSPGVLQVSTMCGHGMVGFPLIKDAVERVRAGSWTAKKAAETLACQCHCGIFNPVRAERLIEAMAGAEQAAD